MNRIRTIALALATTFAISATPAIALADDPPKRDDTADDARKPHFPVDGDEFSSRVEERIAKALERVDHWIEKRDLPANVAQQIRADATRVAEKVRTATAAAAADDSVTKEEAKDIRKMVREERRAMIEKYGEYLPKGAKGKGPGHAKGPGNKPKGHGKDQAPRGRGPQADAEE